MVQAACSLSRALSRGPDVSHMLPDQEIPGSPNRDPDSRFPADRETARFPIPDSRPIGNREIGRESGIGKSPQKTGKRGIRFPIPD
jgi:hypothetical protein